MSKKRRKNFFKRFDYILLLTVILLVIFGLIIISSATANSRAGSFHYLKQQGIAFGLGFIAIIILALIDYDWWGKLYLVIYVFCNLLLVAVLLFGFGEIEWGARSWLAIGGFSFQPSELVKIGLIISMAKIIDNNKEKINKLFTLFKILVFAAIPIVLICLQPDYGTAFVFVFFIGIMLFIAGIDLRYIFYSAIAAIIALPVFYFSLEDSRKNRILDFFNQERNVLGSGYQVNQSIIAIGSGQFTGRGLYNGLQSQFGYIPESQTDFIFAVLGEELGMIGGAGLILLYLIMLLRLINISKKAEDLFGSLIVVGIIGMFIFHIFENIGMTMGLTPVTGIPLPFISYGGTFLLANMIAIGLSLSVGVRKEGLRF